MQLKNQKEKNENYKLWNSSPLSIEIMAKTFSLKLKMLTLDNYDETTDFRSYLAIFCIRMLLWNVNDFILCWVF